MNRIAIAGLIIGIPILFSPVPVKGKMFLSGSGLSLAAIAFLYEKSGQGAIAEALCRKEKQLKKKEDELIKIKAEIEEKRKKLELERDQDLEVISALQHELELEKERLDRVEIVSEKAFEQELAIKKKQVEAECDRELAAIDELRKSNLIEIANIRKKAAILIKKARNKWREQRQFLLVKTSQEVDKSVEEISKELVKEYEGERGKLIEELNELRSQLEKEAKAKYQEWLVPHCQEMDSLLREIESLKSTVIMLKEQIAEDRDIKLSGLRGTVHGNYADHVLRFLKERGTYCDYDSAIIHPDGTFVLNFLPWEIGSKAEKKIKGLLLAMQVEFGCSAVPSFQPNGEARAWTLTFIPARGRAVLSDFYQQIPQETLVSARFQEIEPVIRDGVARQLSQQERVQEMQHFVPPVPLPRPKSWQITELEMECFQWFYSWRSFATEGKQPNICTQEELLYYIYGVRKGRSSIAFDELINESLGDRVNRILSILKMEESNELS